MKKGTKVAVLVAAVASLSLALTGGASGAKKNKIGNQQVAARNLATGAVHCRALDRYLKGHLCGPRATVRRGGIPGPQGPPGPAGPAGSGAAKEVFFAANGVALVTELFTTSGFTLSSDCQGGDFDPMVQANKTGGTLRATAMKSNNTIEFFKSEQLTNGVSFFDPTGALEAIVTFAYAHPDGTNVTGTLQMADGDNSSFLGSVDCLITGHVNG